MNKVTNQMLHSMRLTLVLGALSSLCASQRLANGLGRSHVFSLGQIWLILAGAAVVYALIFSVSLVVIDRLSMDVARVLTVLVIVALVGLFCVVYPHFGLPTNSSGYGDRDDALTLMGRALVQGTNPYGVRTYLGDQVSPLLGSVLLTLPATLLTGSAAWVNPLILVVLGYVAIRILEPKVALMLALIFATNVGFLEDFLLGGDLYLVPLIFAVVVLALISQANFSRWFVVLLVVLGGLTAAARANSLVLLVALVVFVVVKRPSRSAEIGFVGLIGVGLGGLSLKLAGGLDSWPFTGEIDPLLRQASGLIAAVLVLALGVYWFRSRASDAVLLFARTAPWLAVSLVVFLAHPDALFRSWTYLAVGLPVAITAFQALFAERMRLTA